MSVNVGLNGSKNMVATGLLQEIPITVLITFFGGFILR